MRTSVLWIMLAAATPLSAQSTAPVLRVDLPTVPDGVRTVPYGAAVPVLGCDSLAVCRVELEPGERFRMAPALGDSERWLTVHDDGGPVPVVLVKPKACGIATNLMLLTDRRSYDLDLVSGPCKGARRDPLRTVRFTYPDGSAAVATEAVEIRVPSLAERAAQAGNGGYQLRRRGDFPWMPTRVADDGKHVYLELPPAARNDAAPVLYALDSGERTLLNYATEGDLYVTDRLFGRAALVIGNASLDIERRPSRRAPVFNRREVAAVSAVAGLVAALWIGR